MRAGRTEAGGMKSTTGKKIITKHPPSRHLVKDSTQRGGKMGYKIPEVLGAPGWLI